MAAIAPQKVFYKHLYFNSEVAGRNVYQVINYLEHHNTFTSLSPLFSVCTCVSSP